MRNGDEVDEDDGLRCGYLEVTDVCLEVTDVCLEVTV